ncbi:MAG TPA: hypothetical protein VFR07_13250 [Mycobacteriales bacterium]|nr:hypothetical protein [Mycobacteriales bacterium]
MDLLLFSVDPHLVHRSVAAGVTGVVVDWEHRGKARRQHGYDTEVNRQTPADLRRVRAATEGLVVCRVNGYGPWTPVEVAAAVSAGADEILLPMVRTVEEVDRVLDLVAGRCGLGILVETCAAVQRAAELSSRPLSRIYVGLNDLRIDRGSEDLFAPFVDGTVDDVRAVTSVPFGVAGLTRPDAGHPVPSRLLAGELARLAADFTFLRRSYLADTAGRDPFVEVPRILAAVAAARRRTGAQVGADRAALVAAVDAGVRQPA